MHLCSICKIKYPIESFYRHPSHRGYGYACKGCISKRSKELYYGAKSKPATGSLTNLNQTKIKVPYLYLCYKNQTILFVGNTVHLDRSLRIQLYDSIFGHEIDRILTYQCNSESQMVLYKLAFVNKYEPKYNNHIFEDSYPFSFNTPDLIFEQVDLSTI